MKSGTLFFLAVCLAAITTVAADKTPPSLTVAVYDFTDSERGGPSYGAKVTALVTVDLATETNLVMVERTDLKRAIGEQAMGVSGMINSDQAAKIGQLTGAKVLVSGRVIKIGKERLIIVANIVGTETGRLFAEKIEGTPEKFAELCTDLSKRIAQSIVEHKGDFLNETISRDEYYERILKGITGTNRPTVFVNLHFPVNAKAPSSTATGEMGLILQKAGFTVVDNRGEKKPDLEMTGVIDISKGPQRGEFVTFRAVLDVKVQERKTGKIILYDRQSAESVDTSRVGAERSAMAKAVDELAERVLPVLAQSPAPQ